MMIINISDVWEDAKPSHVAFLSTEINKGLKSLGTSDLERQIYSFIEKNKQIILHGSPSDLISSIESFEKIFNNDSRPKVIDKLKAIFDYSDFSKKSEKPWTAYHLCNKARYQICPYCHLVAIGTSLPEEEAKGYRPSIDHYYGKADYPFLSLTLSNFIPCCEKCNGTQMKGQVDFAKNKHLNPLIDDESIIFSLAVDTVSEQHMAESVTLNLPKDRYQLKITATDNIFPAEASLKTFQLVSRYQHYSGQAFYLARKMRGLAARKKMHEAALDLEISIDDYLEFEPENYKIVPYGKARICIAKQFGAIPD